VSETSTPSLRAGETRVATQKNSGPRQRTGSPRPCRPRDDGMDANDKYVKLINGITKKILMYQIF